jgi:membrane fusion protein, multidrug efflux system
MTSHRLLLLAALGLGACTASADKVADQERPAVAAEGRRVEVARLEKSPASLEFTLSGEVEGSRDAALASALGGYVESVRVDGGDSVQAGQLLVAVDRSLYSAAYAQAEAQRDLARTELGRLEKMGDGVSESQRGQAATQLAVAEAGLRQAAVRLKRASVVAPFDGVVSSVAVDEGEVAGPGTPVVRLVQLDPVKVVAGVSDREVVVLEPGLPVRVTAAAVGRQLEGRVSHVSPVGNSQTRSFEVEVEVPNPDRAFLPGMVASIHAARDLGEAIVVSQDWILSTPAGHGVYLADGTTARWRPVELGQVLRNRVVVTEGLEPGDRIVTVGHRELLDGDPLLIARSGVCCTDGRVTYGEGTR